MRNLFFLNLKITMQKLKYCSSRKQIRCSWKICQKTAYFYSSLEVQRASYAIMVCVKNDSGVL